MFRIFISLIFVLKCISCYKTVSLTTEEFKYLDGIKKILNGSQYLSNLEFEKKYESMLCNENKTAANETVNDGNKLVKRIPFKFEEERKCLKWAEEDLEEPIQMHVNDNQEIIDINDTTASDELVYILKAASPMGRPILYFMRKSDDLAYDNEPFIFHMDILKTDHDEWISELKLWNKLDASVKNSYKYMVVAFDGFTMVKREIVVNVFKQEIDETTEEPEIEEHEIVNDLTLKKKINRPQFMIDRPDSENDNNNNFENFKNENSKVIEFLKKQNQNDKVQSVENNSENDNSAQDGSSEQQSEQRDGSESVSEESASQQEENNNTPTPIGIEENDQNFNSTEITANEAESTTESSSFSETTDDYETTEASTTEEPDYSEIESTTRYPTTVMEAIAFNNKQYEDSARNDTIFDKDSENRIDENTNNYDSMRSNNENTEEPFEPEATTSSVDIQEETTYEPETTEETSTEEATNEPELSRIIPSQQFRNYLLQPTIESNIQFEREYSMMERMKQEVESRVMLEIQINEIMEQNRRLEFLRQQALMNSETATETSSTNDTSVNGNQTVESELISQDFNATTIISNSTDENNNSFSENSTASSNVVITTQSSSTAIPVSNSTISEENSNGFQKLNNEILHLFNNVTSFLEDTFKVVLSHNQNGNNKTNKTNENNQNLLTKIIETTTESSKIIEMANTTAVNNSSNTTISKIENDPAEAEHLMGVPDRDAVPFINTVSEADENAENSGFRINSGLSMILISVLLAFFNNLVY